MGKFENKHGRKEMNDVIIHSTYAPGRKVSRAHAWSGSRAPRKRAPRRIAEIPESARRHWHPSIIHISDNIAQMPCKTVHARHAAAELRIP